MIRLVGGQRVGDKGDGKRANWAGSGDRGDEEWGRNGGGGR